jgi:alpha-glucosidase (family GH31 glycosyl hydrolase)
MLDETLLITSDNGPQGLSGVLTPLWLASSGVAILAEYDPPVRVSFNQSTTDHQPYIWNLDTPPPFDKRPAPQDGTGDGLLRLSGRGLRYRILAGESALEAWQLCQPHLAHPAAIPPDRLWHAPIWTSWARYKMFIDQERIVEFADEIIAHNYPHGVMEIDDKWQTHYGDLAFDPARFADPRKMIDDLHARGFAVTCWVMPFINPDADCFETARARGYLQKQADGSPRPLRWWQGNGFLLDVANPEALEWFAGNLRALQNSTGLDGFKFDAGEAIFAQESNDYTHRYVDFIGTHFPFAEVRSGWHNQRAPILFRQWDKSCTWGTDNGLKSVITGALALSLGGYPFVLPDMVGGNAYFGQDANAELMVRWTQASALLPAIQFSLAPWDYGAECEQLCRAALDVRQRYLDRLTAAMRQAAQTGEPVIRPVWWLAPDDPRALVCADEYLVGDSLLVAPVVNPGQRARAVYLPPGNWQDNAGHITAGPVVLPGMPTSLDTLLVYEKEQKC